MTNERAYKLGEAVAAGIKPLAMLKPEDVDRVYSGRPGCGCGCRGKYTDHDSKTFNATFQKLVGAMVAVVEGGLVEKTERSGVMVNSDGSAIFYVETETRYRWIYTVKGFVTVEPAEDMSYVEMAAR